MATTDFIAAIELSSSKISGIAGKKNSDGSHQVLAYACEDASSFIHKGAIYNIDKAAQALTSIINKLEGQLNNSIAKVYTGIGGQSLRTVKNKVSRTLEEESIISQELVDEICDENHDAPLIEMNVLDVAPQEYKIDNTLQAEPVGVTGRYITGQFLNVVSRTSLKKNLEHSFEQAKIEIADDLLVAPIALAKVVLTESEMRSGCALVDFGADTTTISVYKNNILRYLSVLPLGGNNITQDITSLQMEEEDAEKLKLQYGNALYEEEESGVPAVCRLEDGRTFELSLLNNIIGARAEEILANVWNQLRFSGYEDKLFSGVVFTGGGANLKNLEKAFRRISKMEKVKTALFINNTVHGRSEELKKNGMQNTLLGLLAAGNENCCLQEVKPAQTTDPGSAFSQQIDMFDNDETLKEQEAAARAAKTQREKEEKERKERERKEKELREKAEKKKEPGWIEKTFDRLSNKIFSDDDMN
ncbi:cell division protein FtsA [Bacteroides zoogleoformans]|uniref:Cell division protein FtsA n=1 Tax=Bacteroides zoogleoformans TaxID=28119 RepID=A0ABM6T8R3_9BACE|nr:cell division protein FtsA [Bacteroides zoogleoformans]AVM52745.1 cell division protein FtsA [Bacteroides zoogleoformans]TWJ16665.1 cell division protein FtsA [Bacteroides zoogleoformans]